MLCSLITDLMLCLHLAGGLGGWADCIWGTLGFVLGLAAMPAPTGAFDRVLLGLVVFAR